MENEMDFCKVVEQRLICKHPNGSWIRIYCLAGMTFEWILSG